MMPQDGRSCNINHLSRTLSNGERLTPLAVVALINRASALGVSAENPLRRVVSLSQGSRLRDSPTGVTCASLPLHDTLTNVLTPHHLQSSFSSKSSLSKFSWWFSRLPVRRHSPRQAQRSRTTRKTRETSPHPLFKPRRSLAEHRFFLCPDYQSNPFSLSARCVSAERLSTLLLPYFSLLLRFFISVKVCTTL